MIDRWTRPGKTGRIALAVAALLAGGCGPGDELAEPPPAESTPTEEPTPSPEPTPTDEAAMEITGTFTGDAQLEGGCAWVEADDGTRYEVIWPEGYEVTWDPLELHGPDGEVVARDGDAMRVTGAVTEDMASICMVGPIVEAHSVEPA